MGIDNFSKTVKRYRQGNLTAAFGTELLTLGTTAVPNLLLKFYKQMGISDREMMILLQLMRMRTEEKQLHPSPESLSECLTSSLEDINNCLASLLNKEIISHTQYFDEESGEILSGYDLEPLMEKLSEVWACAKMREIERTRQLLENQVKDEAEDIKVSDKLYHAFEKEFGRPLSPMEINQIRKWVEDFRQEEIISEALRRAVLIDKRNFKYIDSILQEWKNNNLVTLQDVENHDRQFKEQTKRRQAPAGQRNKNKGISSNDEKRKEFIRGLYTG